MMEATDGTRIGYGQTIVLGRVTEDADGRQVLRPLATLADIAADVEEAEAAIGRSDLYGARCALQSAQRKVRALREAQ